MDDLLTPPLVDIVIPVHSTARPLERAVRSALRASEGAGPGQCRVLVVAHHLREQEVLAMLPEPLRAAVTVIECEDRGSTAAVPRNEALRRSTARYISFLDSDDTLDPGAVTRWLGIAERRGSDLVIEAIPEVLDIKQRFYTELGKVADAHTIFTTNSSTLLPSAMMDFTGRP